MAKRINVNKAVTSFLKKITVSLSHVGFIVIDVLFGALSLDQLFSDEFMGDLLFFTFTSSLIATIISVITSGAQIKLWDIVFQRFRKKEAGKGILALIPNIVLMAADTALDGMLTNPLMEKGEVGEWPPQNPGFAYWVVYVIIITVTGLNEAIVNVMEIRTESTLEIGVDSLWPFGGERHKKTSRRRVPRKRTTRRRTVRG